MAQSTLPIGKGFFRTDSFPLDPTSVFPSLAEAMDYAAVNPTAYSGQVLGVRETGVSNVYVVQPDKTIRFVGGYSKDEIDALLEKFPQLDENGKLPSSVISDLRIANTHPVVSQSAMLALSEIQPGDLAIRSDINKTFVLTKLPTSTLANWAELLTPSSGVTSVNGRFGAVTLSKSDLGLGNTDNTSDKDKPVSTAQLAAINALLGSTGPAAVLLQSAGIAGTAARSDHSHALSFTTTAPTTLAASASVGSSNYPARSDHIHPRPTYTAAQVGATPSEHGSDATIHVPAITASDVGKILTAIDTSQVPQWRSLPTAILPATVSPKAVATAASIGSSAQYAREDHVHAYGFSSNTPVQIGVTASAGSGTTPARYDHVHTLTFTGTLPSALASTAGAGTSSYPARSDHVHKLPTPGDIGAVPESHVDDVTHIPASVAADSGKYLRSNGSVAPDWGTISIPAASSTTPTAVRTASVGSLGTWARADHSHALSFTATVPTALASSAAVGTSTYAARSDHAHPYPTAAQVGAATASDLSTHVALTAPHSATSTPTASRLTLWDASKKLHAASTTASDTATTLVTKDWLGTAARLDTGTASGNIPTLNSAGVLSLDLLPSEAKTLTFTAISQAAMLALSAATQGDFCFRTDENKTYLFKGGSPATASNWAVILTPAIPVAGTTTPGTVYTASIGTSEKYAREDHAHALSFTSTTPVAIGGTTDTVGTSAYPARSDHRHALSFTASVPTALASSAAVGTSTYPARSDHVHPYPTAAQVGAASSTDLSNHTGATAPHSATSTPTASKLVLWDANKKLYAASTTASDTATTLVTKDWLGTAARVDTGTASGNVPTLNTSGVISVTVLPDDVKTNTFTAASQTAMLALSTATQGDLCFRSDESKTYILKSGSPATLANWTLILTPTIPIAATATPDTVYTAAVGTSEKFAREDHRHAISFSTSTPVAIGGTTASAGSSAYPARYDHRHALSFTATVPTALASSAAVGTSTYPARSDHVHLYPTAAQVGAASSTDLSNHTAATAPHSATSTPTASRLVLWDANKKLYAASTTASDTATTLVTKDWLGTAARVDTGTASGNVPTLNSAGVLAVTVLPDDVKTNTFTAASQTAMLALSTATQGDLCFRTDENKTYILKSGSPATVANWAVILTPDIPAAGTATPGTVYTASVGTSEKYAREDHRHALSFTSTAPVAIGGTTATVGTSTYPSRSDHRHALTFTTTVPTSLASSAAVGSSTYPSRSDHAHPYPTAAQVGAAASSDLSSHVALTAPHSATSTPTASRLAQWDASKKLHAASTVASDAGTVLVTKDWLGTAARVNTGTASGNVPTLNSSGVLAVTVLPAEVKTSTFTAASQTAMLALSTATQGDLCFRTDENKTYILKTSAPATLANWAVILTPTVPVAGTVTPGAVYSAAVGTSTKFAREDHTHALSFTTTSPVAIGGTTATVGTSAYPARSDHRHALGFTTTVPTKAGGVSTSTVGTSTYPARSDHTHALNFATTLPSNLAASASAGSSNYSARLDHVHQRPTASEIGAATLTSDMPSPLGPNTSVASIPEINNVTWADGLRIEELDVFVLIGTNVTAWSEDGFSWTKNTLTGTFAALYWCVEKQQLIAVGTNVIAVSTDGKTWTSYSHTGAWKAITWVAYLNKYVVIGNGVGLTSVDGVTWTTLSGVPTKTWSGIAYSNEKRIIVASATSGSPRLSWTTNLTDWTDATVSYASNAWWKVLYLEKLGLFVTGLSGSGTGVAISSIDGKTWASYSKISHNPEGYQKFKTRFGSLYIGIRTVNGTTTIYYFWEKDIVAGGTYQSISSTSINLLIANTKLILYSQKLNRTIVVSQQLNSTYEATIQYSEGLDFKLWSTMVYGSGIGTEAARVDHTHLPNTCDMIPRPASEFSQGKPFINSSQIYLYEPSIAYSPTLKRYVVSGYYGVFWSDDAFRWNMITTAGGTGHVTRYRVVWFPEKNLFVITGSAKIWTSSDGKTFTERVAPTGLWYDICYSPSLNRFVMTGISSGGNPSACYSSDCVTWTYAAGTPVTDATSVWRNVCWAEKISKFVATSGYNQDDSGPEYRLMYSVNGMTWNAIIDPQIPKRCLGDIIWLEEPGLFVVGFDSSTTYKKGGYKYMFSSDALNWTVVLAESMNMQYGFTTFIWIDSMKRLVGGGGMPSHNGIIGSESLLYIADRFDQDGPAFEPVPLEYIDTESRISDFVWSEDHQMAVGLDNNGRHCVYSFDCKFWFRSFQATPGRLHEYARADHVHRLPLEIGDLSKLKTTEKRTLVDAMNELYDRT